MPGREARAAGPVLTVADVDWLHPDAVALRAAQQVELSARYGDDGTPEPPATHVVATVLLLADGVPVGCGSLRDRADTLGAGVVEAKRVYVCPEVRGRGYSRRLMAALESRAAGAGYRRVVLEAGLQQPEAIGLYLGSGYAPVPTYGEWAGVADSRCFAKPLDGGAVADAGRAPAVGDEPRAGDPPDGAPGAPDVEEVPVAHPDAVRLRAELDAELLTLYPELSDGVAGGPAGLEALADGALVTVVARRAGAAVGCASLARARDLTGPEPADRTGELRRVHVAPAARRSGVAAAMVRALERRAVALGMTHVVLETGIRQPAAVALYRSLGYRPVFPFGDWQDDALGLFLGRSLCVPPGR